MACLEESFHPRQHHALAVAAEIARAQSGREHLAIHARQLALEPRLQILRRHPRSLLLRLEQAHRHALENHVHRDQRLGLPVMIIKTWYKGRLLADIYETARTSIGLPLPIDAPAIRMFRMVIAEARSLIRQRNEIEDMADAMLRDSADYKALRKVPGIGPVIALTILAEGGDLRRFRHHRQFLKFCGLDLSTQQSGQHRGQTRLSKFGNARLRRTLWIAGQVAIR